MGEHDELLSKKGVLVTGRFGPNWQIVEHEGVHLFFEQPGGWDIAQWFSAAIAQMLDALFFATDRMLGHASSLDPMSWTPMSGWTIYGKDYAMLVQGDRFLFAEHKNVESFDELTGLLAKPDSNSGPGS
jgi:roadblock/LC7 domain-containing protein